MSEFLGIADLLNSRGLAFTKKCKLVRHQDDRFDIQQLRRTGWMDAYQALQKRPVFRDCSYVVSFVGDGGGRAKLIGVYKVKGERKSLPSDYPKDSPFYSLRNSGLYWYDLDCVSEFDDLVDRVVIEWSSERGWPSRLLAGLRSNKKPHPPRSIPLHASRPGIDGV